jgi:DNA gyrase/topoisomerase IV subunit A
MGKYHPHGDMSIYDAIKHMVNWFEIYEPLIFGQGGRFIKEGKFQNRM